MDDDEAFVLPKDLCRTCGCRKRRGHQCKTVTAPYPSGGHLPARSVSTASVSESKIATQRTRGDDTVVSVTDRDGEKMSTCLRDRDDDESKPTSKKKSRLEGKEHVWLSSMLLNHENVLEENKSLKAQLLADKRALAVVVAQNKELNAAIESEKAARVKEMKKATEAQAAQELQAAIMKEAARAKATLPRVTPPEIRKSLRKDTLPMHDAYAVLIDVVVKGYRARADEIENVFLHTNLSAPSASAKLPTPPKPPVPPSLEEVITSFTPIVGNECQYGFGQHTYNVIVRPYTPLGPLYPIRDIVIQQFNRDRDLWSNSTGREVRFFDATAISNGELPANSNPSFYIEEGVAGSGMWREITDDSVIGQLATLGTAVTSKKPAPSPPPPPAPPPPKSKVLWKTNLLFREPCPVFLDTALLTRLKDSNNFSDDKSTQIEGSKALTDLATLFSSYAQKFKYDEHKTTLWVKPTLFKNWIETALG